MKILVAEDNIDSRELLSEILTAMGHEVILAFDGVNALEKLDDHDPDLAILDVDMPRKDGFEVVKNLKDNPETATIPVIMLTARSDVESRVMGLGLGADDYLSKPFNPRELMARVNTRLRAKAETDDLRQTQELIKQTFSKYVPEQVIQYMLANSSEIKLGGQVRQVTVMFADIEGFTTVSEHNDPVELLNVLNKYHGLLVSKIKSNGGTIDKFLGDGIMALFNAPVDQDDHVFQAVKTAIEIRHALKLFHMDMEESFRLGVNIGIHTGQAVVGNVGGSELMDYTAVGDTVNLAARLQGLSNQSEITISAATYDIVKDRIRAELQGERLVKGRETAVTIYHVKDFS